MIATIALTLLLWHASRIALGLNEWPRGDAPVSNALSHLFGHDRDNARAGAGASCGRTC